MKYKLTKFISILITITFLWQETLSAQDYSLRPLAAKEKRDSSIESRTPTAGFFDSILGCFKALNGMMGKQEIGLPHGYGTAEIECVVPANRKEEVLWDAPQAQVAMRQLTSANRAVLMLKESGLLGSASADNVAGVKKKIDDISATELRTALEACPYWWSVVAGEYAPKGEEVGEQPGLKTGEHKKGLKPIDARQISHVAADAVDGTTVAATGISGTPTVLIFSFGAAEGKELWPDEISYAVMGPKDIEIKIEEIWENGKPDKKAIEKYLIAVADSKKKEVKDLRLVADKGFSGEVIEILKDMGIEVITPDYMLEQLHVVPSSVKLHNSKDGEVDAIIAPMGSVEAVMCCITLAALKRDLTMKVIVGDKIVTPDNVADLKVPIFQTIAAIKNSPELGLEMSETGAITQSLFVASNGAVYKVSFYWTDKAAIMKAAELYKELETSAALLGTLLGTFPKGTHQRDITGCI